MCWLNGSAQLLMSSHGLRRALSGAKPHAAVLPVLSSGVRATGKTALLLFADLSRKLLALRALAGRASVPAASAMELYHSMASDPALRLQGLDASQQHDAHEGLMGLAQRLAEYLSPTAPAQPQPPQQQPPARGLRSTGAGSAGAGSAVAAAAPAAPRAAAALPLDPVSQQLGFFLQSRSTCSNCSSTYTQVDVALSLELALPAGELTLDRIFSHAVAEEKAPDRNCANRSCRKRGDGTRRLTIRDAPRTLLLTFKRFSQQLDGSWERDNRPVLLTEQLKHDALGDASYRLQGVLRHVGSSAARGHYTAAGASVCIAHC